MIYVEELHHKEYFERYFGKVLACSFRYALCFIARLPITGH